MDRGPRILFYTGGFSPIGGIETFTTELATDLARSGWPVKVHGWDSRSPSIPRLRQSGVQVGLLPWRWGCRWSVPDLLVLPTGILHARRAEVVVFGKTFHPRIQRLIAAACRRGLARPKLVYITPYRPAELWQTELASGRTGTVASMLNDFDLILGQAKCFVEDLGRLGYRGRSYVVPYLPPRVVRPFVPYPRRQLTLGFLGRLEPQKNLAALLRIFQALRQRFVQIPGQPCWPRLLLFGAGSQSACLRSLAEQLGVAEQVEFAGAISREAVPAAVGRCHLCCFTSSTEGQALACFEILACGRPVVAFGVGALAEILNHPDLGTAVPFGNEGGFLHAVEEVFSRQAEGSLTPSKVQNAYESRFNRAEVLETYLRLLRFQDR